MKNILYLTLVLLSLYIIISGCGGGTGTTQPASLTTPVPNSSGNKAYITITIKWPEQGKAGNFIISSGNKKEITASMPAGSHKIKAYVVDYTDKDPNALIDFNATTGLLASGIAEYPATQLALEVPLDSAIARHLTGSVYLPPFPVKIWAGAFGASGDPNDPNTALISTEQYVELEVGPQLVTLPLGDYDLTLTADPNTIVLGGSTVSGSNLISNIVAVPTPTPGRTVIKNNLTPMNPCMAEITPEGSPLPTDTPTPTPTPIRVSSDITATLMIKYPTPTVNPTANTDTTTPPTPTPKFVANKRITFTLIEGNDDYTTLSSDETIASDTVTGITNSNGICKIKLLAGTKGEKVIKASFMADANDPNSVYSDQCTVIVITPTPTPTPIRTPTNVPMNVAGNWEDGGNEAGYTITQSGRELTFTCIYPGTPSTPTPTTTPPSINPTPTLRPLPSEGSWIGIIYEDNSISMWPEGLEPMFGKVKIYRGELYITWVGGYSNRYYSTWIRK